MGAGRRNGEITVVAAHPCPGYEPIRGVGEDLDADLAVKTMGLDDTSDDEPLGLHGDLLDDLDERACSGAGGGGARDLSDGARDTTALADHAAHVVGMNVQAVDGTTLALDAFDSNDVGMLDQGSGKEPERPRYEVLALFLVVLNFCHMPVRLSSAVALSDGCAPLESQCSARVSSIAICDGFVSGLYCPRISTKRPSRGERWSETTTR